MSPSDLAIGRGTLRKLHASLASHAPEQTIAILQEAGYAAGEASYRAFAAWLNERAGVDSPANLDAELLTETLSEFFASGGWGTVTMTPVGTGALALDSSDWAEADPCTAQAPMGFFSAGIEAAFLGRDLAATGAPLGGEGPPKGGPGGRGVSGPPGMF